MSDLEGDVQAIVPTHGHLDHIDAISKLAHRYNTPIVATPFTLELVKEEIQDEGTSTSKTTCWRWKRARRWASASDANSSSSTSLT